MLRVLLFLVQAGALSAPSLLQVTLLRSTLKLTSHFFASLRGDG